MVDKNRKPSEIELKWHSITERHKTIRTCFVTLCIVAGLWIILHYTTKMLEKPPWLEALIIILGVGSAPSALFLIMVKYIRRVVEKCHGCLGRANV